MTVNAVRWFLMIAAVGVALVGLLVASGAFNRAMDEDIDTLSSRLKGGGSDPKQAEAVTAAFRSTQYNVRNLAANVCYALTGSLAIVWVTTILVGRTDHAKAAGTGGQPGTPG